MHLPCRLRGQDRNTGDGILVEYAPVLIGDAGNRKETGRSGPAAGKGREGQRQLVERHLARSEVGIGNVAERGTDPGRLADLADRIESGPESQPDNRRILATRNGLGIGHRPLVVIVGTLHAPFAEDAVVPSDHDVVVVDAGVVHGLAGKDSRGIRGGRDHRSEERSGRAAPLKGAIVLAVEEIPATGHRKDPSGGIVDREHRPLQVSGRGHRDRLSPLGRLLHRAVDLAVFRKGDVGESGLPLHRLEIPPQGPLRRLLHPGVDRGVDPHAIIHRPVEAERRNRLLADQVHGIGDLVWIRPLADKEIQLHGRVVLLTRDQVQFPHPPQDEVPDLLRPGMIVPGGKGIGTLEKPRQHRAFPDRKILGWFSEISACRRLHPVETAAEIDTVQVELHDLFLREMILDPLGQEHFQQFSAVAPLLQFEGVSGQLLGHRAGPLLHPSLMIVADRRSQDAHVVHPVMLEEPVILLGHDRIHHGLRDLVIGNRQSVLDEDLSDLLAAPVQNDTGRFHAGHLVEVEHRGLGLIFRHHPPVDRETHYPKKQDQPHRHEKPEPQIPWFPAALLTLLPTVAMAYDRRRVP